MYGAGRPPNGMNGGNFRPPPPRPPHRGFGRGYGRGCSGCLFPIIGIIVIGIIIIGIFFGIMFY